MSKGKTATKVLTKAEALLKHLDDDSLTIDDIEQSSYDADLYEVGKEEYLVLTDEEADKRAAEQIKDSAWAFNKSFLDGHSEAIAAFDGKTWEAVTARCESANDAVLKLIDDVDHFVDDAIAADGRGHFLSGYDGDENEQDGFYIYRTN